MLWRPPSRSIDDLTARRNRSASRLGRRTGIIRS